MRLVYPCMHVLDSTVSWLCAQSLHFHSLWLPLLMPEVALYEKWDQWKVNWSAVTLLCSQCTSSANPSVVKFKCLSMTGHIFKYQWAELWLKQPGSDILKFSVFFFFLGKLQGNLADGGAELIKQIVKANPFSASLNKSIFRILCWLAFCTAYKGITGGRLGLWLLNL